MPPFIGYVHGFVLEHLTPPIHKMQPVSKGLIPLEPTAGLNGPPCVCRVKQAELAPIDSLYERSHIHIDA
jgi:hypothetical protein